jgi:phage terminase large subunit-like protein
LSKEHALDKLFSGLADKLTTSRDLDMADRGTTDFLFFAREIMGNQVVFPPSLDKEVAGDWAKLFHFVFGLGAEGTNRFRMVNSPRNSYKTTLLVARCAYLIAHDRNIRICYTTNTRDNAIQFSESLQNALTHNQKLIEAYGSFAPSKEVEDTAWRQDFFTVTGRTTNVREPTFTASSVGRTKVGMHYDVLVYDDCVDGENSGTGDALMKLRKWFILSNSLVDQNSKYGPGGCIYVNGTRYADGDLYGWLLGEVDADESPAHLYDTLVLRAMENPQCWDPILRKFINPKLNFPSVLTEEKLAVQRSQGPYHFFTQYQNECVSPDDAHFIPEWFTVVKPYDIPTPEELRCYIFTDFAFGLDDSNDRTAIWAVGLDWERKAYCLDFDVGRWPLNERCKRVITLAERYDAQKIAVEQVSSNEGIRAELERLRNMRRLRLKIEEIGGRSMESKMLRIVSMQPRFEQRRIFFVERDNNDTIGIKPKFIHLNRQGLPEGEIVQEFCRFPRATHDDIPDALSDIDKRDYNGTYLFTGASARALNRTRGPTVMNGTVLYKMGDPYGQEIVQRPEEADPYARRAARIRGRQASAYTRRSRRPY